MQARHSSSPHASEKAPWDRWLALLRPERVDVLVVALFSLVVGLLMLATPIAVESLVNTVAFGNLMQPVIVLAGLLFVCLAFVAVIQALQRYVVELLHRRVFVRMIATFAYRIPRARYEVFNGRSAALVNRFFEVVIVDKAGAQLLMDAVFLIIQTLVSMVVLAFYHPYLLGFDIVLVAVMLFIIFVLGRRAVASAIEESKHKHEVAAWLEEIALHELAFKVGAGKQVAFERAGGLAANYVQARQMHFRLLMRQIVFALALQATASTVLLGLGGWLVISRELTLGQLVAAELIVTVIVGAFAKFGKHLESFYDLMASMDELGELLDVPLESEDGNYALADGAGQLTLRDVRVDVNDKAILGPVSAAIPGRSRVLVDGPPASGKSLFMEILFGLHDWTQGYAEFKHCDLRELHRDELRGQVALIRDSEIIEGSVRENVALGRTSIGHAEVRTALAEVGLLDAILALPQGIDTPISAARPRLSGSQQLALMFARAIAQRPSLLLVDGALDPLHGDLFARIAGALFHPEADWTLMVVTRRPELIEACDLVLELPDGRIQERPAVRSRIAEQKLLPASAS